MNAPDVLQNIRSKHPVAYVVLYLFVGWALLVVITHAIAFGAELLVASSDKPVVKWEATDECVDGTRTVYYNSPSLYQEFKVKIETPRLSMPNQAFIQRSERPSTPSMSSTRTAMRRIVSTSASWADRHALVCSNAIYAAPHYTYPKYRCTRTKRLSS